MSTFLELATKRTVAVRALKTALLVGVLLIAINHGNALLAGEVGTERLLKMLLTFAVPYGVSTYASVAALRDQLQAAPNPVETGEENKHE